jgi:hypothetical protein
MVLEGSISKKKTDYLHQRQLSGPDCQRILKYQQKQLQQKIFQSLNILRFSKILAISELHEI